MGNTNTSNGFFEQTQQEHEHLRGMLGEVRRSLRRREDTIDRVAELLNALSYSAQMHFDQEETSGFFKEIVERAPRLSDRADALIQEHAELRETIRQLVEQARKNRKSSNWWDETEDAFHDFSKRLMRHESEENSLLQEAYGVDIGSQD